MNAAPSRRWDGEPETDTDRRFFDLRESGYRGWIDQDGHPQTPAEHEAWLQRAADGAALAEALRVDDRLEDEGMHPDNRLTCHSCQSWADHAHDPLTGRRITLDEYEQRTAWLGPAGGA